MSITVSDKGGIPDIDDDTYVLRLVDHDRSISKFDDKPQFEFTYEVAEGEYEGIRLKRWVNLKEDAQGNITAHPKSTIYKDLCALNGVKELGIGDAFELDELVGNLVLGDIREKGVAGNERPRIVEVRPMRKKTKRATTEEFD